MTRPALLFASGLLGTLCTAGNGYGQDSLEADVASRAISYLTQKYVQSGMLPTNPSVVIDPAVITGPLNRSELELPDRANVIAERTGAHVRTLREQRICTGDEVAICRLTADIVFRAGEAVIEDDSARILLKFWWNAPGRREPTPSAAIEITLRRSGGEWNVVNERQIMIS